MHFVWEEFSPKENASYGEELAKSAAHLAVRELWARRLRDGVTQEQIAASIGKDPAWLSRTMKGPANWTLKSLGALVVALDGKLNIQVEAVEDDTSITTANFNAYDAADTSVVILSGTMNQINDNTSEIKICNIGKENNYSDIWVVAGDVL